MNERIKELAKQAGHRYVPSSNSGPLRVDYLTPEMQRFAELIVAKVLDEVATRAFVSGDRAWSDDVDRPWIELEFGLGRFAEAQRKAGFKHE